MKKLSITLLMALVWITGHSYAQNGATHDKMESGMHLLEGFAGHWQSKGWVLDENGQKMDLEHIYFNQSKMNGKLYVMEWTAKLDGKEVRKSLATVRYNAAQKNFALHIYDTIEDFESFTLHFDGEKFY